MQTGHTRAHSDIPGRSVDGGLVLLFSCKEEPPLPPPPHRPPPPPLYCGDLEEPSCDSACASDLDFGHKPCPTRGRGFYGEARHEGFAFFGSWVFTPSEAMVLLPHGCTW